MNSKQAQRYREDGMAVTPRPQLVVKLYERLASDLFQASKAAGSGEVEAAHTALLHAQDIVFELTLALDVDAWAGGAGLRALYQHLSGRLLEANVHKSREIIDECSMLIAPLVGAWQEALQIVQQSRVASPAYAAGQA